MITGKDKERVRMLRIQCELSRELIETVKNDMEQIMEHLQNEGIDITGVPLYKLPEDIGRCIGHLDYFK